MSRKIKLSDGTEVNYPDDSEIKKMIELLSSDDVIGSSVLPENATESDKIKYKLCEKILEYKIKNNLSQKELGEKLFLDEPEISRVIRYKIERYSIERLLGYATVLYPNLTLQLLAA